jgi:hypothetical protein
VSLAETHLRSYIAVAASGHLTIHRHTKGEEPTVEGILTVQLLPFILKRYGPTSLKQCAKPDPGSGAFLTHMDQGSFRSWIRDPGSGVENCGSAINIPDPQHWFKAQNFCRKAAQTRNPAAFL